jgi:alcohol dehydrogenase class IV
MSLQQFLTFHAPTKILCGPGALAALPAELTRLSVRRPLVVTDQGIKRSGLLEKVTAPLTQQEISFAVFDSIEENPAAETVMNGAEVYASENCAGLIAIGGGSSIDAAKAIGVVVSNGGNVTDYRGVEKVPKATPPLIAIPTTYGTGSETTSVAVITDRRTLYKFAIISPHIFCASAILDPNLLLTLPRKLGAATGMDALTHAIEAHASLTAHQMTSALALHAIKLIAENLRQAIANDYNLTSTENMMVASTLAGIALSNARLGTVHAMAHPLSGHCGIHHGVACAILLPHVMEFNLGSSPEKFGEIARAMGEMTAGLSVMDAAWKAVEAVRRLSRDVDIPLTLQEVGARLDKLPELVKDSMASGAILVNPRKTNEQDVERLFRKAFA